jgi:hypothetical protein
MPDNRHLLYLVQSSANSKDSLLEFSVETGESRVIADDSLFDDPLHWRH